MYGMSAGFKLQYTPTDVGFTQEEVCMVCKNVAGDEKKAMFAGIT